MVGVVVSAKLNPSTNHDGSPLTFTDQFLKLDFCDRISLSHCSLRQHVNKKQLALFQGLSATLLTGYSVLETDCICPDSSSFNI